MEQFGRTGQITERGLPHLAVGSPAQGRVLQQTDRTETDNGGYLLGHRRAGNVVSRFPLVVALMNR